MAGKVYLKSIRGIGAVSLTALLLAGCSEGPLASLNLGLGQQTDKEEVADTTPTQQTTETVERDVEAPEVFEVSDKALWDGRPSLGGVWVAHADNKEPERVIIRNESNGKFVVGALFRRERDLPGPSLQLSSDAAAALGVQAGSPTKLRVTALRREAVPVNPPAPEVEPGNTDAVTEAPLKKPDNDTEAIAASALASLKAKDALKTKPVKAAVKPTPAPKQTKVSKPYVQIGFFSVETNAKANVASMKANGIPAKVVSTKTNGKTFYRVLAGPAGTGTEQKQLLDMVKKQGFSDAYLVKG